MHKYRPDIDGLRAVAVLAVIAYHAFPHRFMGGFVGVDIFFVISGYLISGILMNKASAGGINFGDFYQRRINRIFPSLALILFSCLGIGWISLFSNEFHQLGADVSSSATFSANFSLLGQAGYFDRSADTKPLLHLWSLAIEEQFYVLWPLCIWAIGRFGRRWTLWLGAFSVLSFVCNVFVAAHSPVADFYSPLTRFWELSLGGVLAAFQLEHVSSQRTLIQQRVLSIAGMAALAIALFFISSDSYPGVKALLPVIGAIALIAAGAAAPVNRIILANRAMRWIGAISYPLYLWHWPLLSYARILEGQTPVIALRGGAICAAFILAVITHYLIENPLRSRANSSRKMLTSITAMVVVAMLGQYVFLQHGVPQRMVVTRNPAYVTDNAGGAGPFALSGCDLPKNRFPRVDGCLMDTRTAPGYALIGDSKAGALAPGIFRVSEGRGSWLYMGNNDGKGTYMSTTLLSQTAFPHEYALTREMLDVIEAQPSIQVVVIANAVRNLYGLADETSLRGVLSHPHDDALTAAFDSVVSELLAHRRKVFIVIDNPTLRHPEDCIGRITSQPLVNRLLELPAHPQDCTVKYTQFIALTLPYRRLLADLKAKHPSDVTVIPTSDIYCDIHADLCPMVRHGRRLYGYTDHPSDYAAGLVASRIIATISHAAK